MHSSSSATVASEDSAKNEIIATPNVAHVVNVAPVKLMKYAVDHGALPPS